MSYRQRLIEKARIATERAQRLRRQLYQRDSWGFAGYMLYRNRYSLLIKLFTRLIVVLEVYLIYHLIHSRLAASISFVLHLFFLISQGFGGITQGVRVWLMHNRRGKRAEKARFITIAAAVATIGSCTTILALSHWLDLKDQAFFLLMAGLVIVPLDLIETLLWNVLYTERRAPRNFWVIAFCRLLPIFALIVSLETAGYLAGLILGRLAESLYLVLRASKEIVASRGRARWCRERLVRRKNGAIYLMETMAGVRFLAPYISISASTVVFQVGISWIVFLRDQHLWLVTFGFFQALYLLLYVAQRPAFSLAFDLFMAAKRGAAITAAYLMHRICNWTLFIIGCSFLFLLAVLLIVGARLVVFLPDLWELMPWLALMTICRGVYLARLSVMRTLGLDGRRWIVPPMIFIVIGLPVLYWIGVLERGNLAALFLADSLLHLLATWLLGRIRFQDSPFPPPHRITKERCVALQNASGILIALANRPNGIKRDGVKKIASKIPGVIEVIDVARDLFLIVIARDLVDAENNIYRELSGAMCATARWQNRHEVNLFLRRISTTRNCDRRLRRFAQLVISGGAVDGPSVRERLATLPRIEFKKGRERITGNPQLREEFMSYLFSCDRRNGSSLAGELDYGRFVVERNTGEIVAIYDCSNLSESDLERIKGYVTLQGANLFV